MIGLNCGEVGTSLHVKRRGTSYKYNNHTKNNNPVHFWNLCVKDTPVWFLNISASNLLGSFQKYPTIRLGMLIKNIMSDFISELFTKDKVIQKATPVRCVMWSQITIWPKNVSLLFWRWPWWRPHVYVKPANTSTSPFTDEAARSTYEW